MTFDVWAIAQIIVLAMMMIAMGLLLTRPRRNVSTSVRVTALPPGGKATVTIETPRQLINATGAWPHGVYVPPNAKSGMYIYTVDGDGRVIRHPVPDRDTYDAVMRIVRRCVPVPCPNAGRCSDPTWCEQCGSCRVARNTVALRALKAETVESIGMPAVWERLGEPSLAQHARDERVFSRDVCPKHHVVGRDGIVIPTPVLNCVECAGAPPWDGPEDFDG